MNGPHAIQVGEALPVQERRPTTVSIFLYGAALWTPHRIHYDQAYARSEGWEDVLVLGPMLASYALQAVTDWLGPAGRVTRLSYRNLAPVYPENLLRTRAVLTARAGRSLTFALALERGDATVLGGSAEVELFATGA